jgi:hypothetical protein
MSLFISSFFSISEGVENRDDIKGSISSDIVKLKANHIEEGELLEDEEKKINELEVKEENISLKLKELLGKLSGEEKETLSKIITEVSSFV